MTGDDEVKQLSGLPYFGSCFCYRNPSYFLTAAHCVRDERLKPTNIGVSGWFRPPTGGEMITVRRRWFHPTADLAVLQVGAYRYEDNPVPLQPHETPLHLGDDLVAFGFPASVEDDPPMYRPTARLFKGHVQRLFEHNAQDGSRYAAAELNVAAPRGLSGGPVFRYENGEPRLLGLVTQNLETTTLRDLTEDIEEDGKRVRVERHAVINYGVCVLIHPIRKWVDDLIEEHGIEWFPTKPDPTREAEGA